MLSENDRERIKARLMEANNYEHMITICAGVEKSGDQSIQIISSVDGISFEKVSGLLAALNMIYLNTMRQFLNQLPDENARTAMVKDVQTKTKIYLEDDDEN